MSNCLLRPEYVYFRATEMFPQIPFDVAVQSKVTQVVTPAAVLNAS